MATIVLFHHVHGLTEGVLRFADAFRAGGHEVLTPDLFDGLTFVEQSDGLAHFQAMGMDTLIARAEEACEGLPEDVVYAGMSLGVLPAQHLLQSRPGARGALLYHGFIDPTDGPGPWPDDVPVHVFAMADDPYFVSDGDHDAAKAWQAKHPNLENHLFDGNGHVFTDPISPDHEPATTAMVIAQSLEILADIAR